MTFFDDFVWRALLAGLGVALIAGPLGSFVVWGRMAFFGDTIAHSALFGVALGLILGVGQTPAIVLVAALVAVLLVTLQGNGRVASDTLLGIVAHGFLAAGLVALSFLRTVRVDLLGYLFGDILSVTSQDIWVIWIAALFGLAAMAAIWRPLLSVTVHADLARVEGVPVKPVRLAFLLVIALTVALAIKVVGLLPITALLIIPPAAVRRFVATPEAMALFAAGVGSLSVLAGLLGSLEWDTPSGPSIVVAATVAFVVAQLWPRARRRTG
jgi:zinc transport system permease protein